MTQLVDYKKLYELYHEKFYTQFPKGEIAFKKNKRGFIQFNPFYQEDPSFQDIVDALWSRGQKRNRSIHHYSGYSTRRFGIKTDKQEFERFNLNILFIKQPTEQEQQQVIAILNLSDQYNEVVQSFSITIKNQRVTQFMSLETGLPITFKQFIIVNQLIKLNGNKEAEYYSPITISN